MIIKLIIGILFLVFAGVQYNDPDPWLWILAYSSIGILTIYSAFRTTPTLVLNILIVVFILLSAFYIPRMMEWIGDGMPSIVGEMKASTPHIEWMREFLGLLLSTITLIWLRRSSIKKESEL